MAVTTDDKHFSWFDLIKATWYFLKEDRSKYVVFSVLLMMVFAYDLVPPFVVGEIVNFFTTYKAGDDLTKFYILALFLGISHTIVGFIRLTIKKNLSFIATNSSYRIKVEGFERLMDFSLRWHQAENSGNKVQKIQTGANSLNTFMKLLSSQIFRIVISIIGVSIIFLFLQPIFALFLIVYFSFFILIEKIFMRLVSKANTDYYKSTEKSSGTYYESTSNLLTIKTLGIKDSVKANVTNTEANAKVHAYRTKTLSNNKWKLFQLLNGVSVLVFLLLIGQEFLTGAIAVGAIFVYFSYFQKLTSAASDISDIIFELIDTRAGTARMMPLFLDTEKTNDGHLSFPQDWKSITINNGGFRYKLNDETFALENLNLSFEKNQKIGIVGHSGSGKSTLAKLLLGVYDLEHGSFKIGNTNYYDIKHTEVSKHISTVLQETELFNMTLRENITMMKVIDEKLLSEAITISQLDEVIQNLPDGLNTLIGEKGYRLSGGERQRLGIARAIYTNSEILVLDEATSALDSKTESMIQTKLETKLAKKTLIIIAHRLSTLRNVDKIFVFEKGKVIEEGNFHELSQREGSKFKEMYELQNKKEF